MFTVKECTQSSRRCGDCAAECKFVGSLPQHRRIFAFDDGGVKAVGVISLDKGCVVFCGVYGSVTAPERDLITRAVLNVCKGMNPIYVRVNEINDYYAKLGFKPDGSGMKVLNKDIVF